MKLPDHLGGHCDQTHTCLDTLAYLALKYDIQSMVDVGCGPGGMVELARTCGIDALGIDGDYTLVPLWESLGINYELRDFTKPSNDLLSPDLMTDLAWSVEFLEHVEEKYQHNYMSVFNNCKYALVTAAPPGAPGHHHVNCRSREYWIDVFAGYGFDFDEEETEYIKANCTMRKPFIQRTGMFFKKR